jgi:cysteine desulfurase/selenocysteine lyase
MNEKLQKIRQQFPILNCEVNGKPLVYLDNAATTQKPQSVIDRITRYYMEENSNVHRGLHHLSQVGTAAFEESRRAFQKFLNSELAEEIIFTKGTTESINLLAFSFGEAFIHEGDEIVISVMEHHANIVPWQQLCGRTGAVLKVVPVNDAGELDMEEYKKLLGPKVKMVSIAHVSNTLGTVNPVAEIVRLGHEAGARVHLDGAQAAAHVPVDVRALGVDFYSLSVHKMYGPMGVGVLYGKAELLNAMPPWQTGGEMIDKVTFEKTTFADLPYKFETGTPDVAGVLASVPALEFLQETGWDFIAEREHALVKYAMEKLEQIDGVSLVGTAKEKGGVVSFNLKGVHSADAATIFDHFGVAVRSGHHCAQPIMARYGITGTLRASFAVYNTEEEIDVLVKAIEKTVQMFG